MNRIRRIPFVLLAVLLVGPIFAQQAARQADPTLLTLDTIFSYGAKSLGWHQWQADGSGYLMLEPSAAGRGALDLVRYDAASGARTILVSAQNLTPPGAQSPLVIEEFTLSADNKRLLVFTNSERVWRSNTRGDYWVYDLDSKKLKKLGDFAKPSSLMFAKFSPDATHVGYVIENNLYVEDLGDNRVKQLTTDGAQYTVNGTFDWVYEEELFCRDGWRWSPDGKQIAYWQLDASRVKEFKMINNTDELYPKIISFPYPKAGEMNSAARVGVVSIEGGGTQWFQVPGDARANYLPRMEWAASSNEVLIQQLNRLQNTNTVMLGDVQTGKVRTVLTEKDDAWVDVSWGAIDWDRRGLARGDVEWIEGGKRFLWVSERDGWRHVYSVSRDGSDVKCITPGNYDLIGVELVDVPNGWIYFSASPENATQKYLFRTRIDGSGKAERLSPASQPGTHNYTISPRGNLAIHTYSATTKAPVTDVVRFPQHAVVRTMFDNKELAERLAKLKPVTHEFFRVKIEDGVELDGWMMKPPGFDATKKYPVLFHVYGEPWGQTVLDAWSGGQAMWHQMLAQQGYVVMSVDNRGTPAPRGRAWRKSIYRKMGIRNSLDQANAARAISKWPFVDAARIGIWGWSGGGSSTLNAMFRYPDVYKVGMSVAPVPDIRYYDSIYQERYCGLPQDHPDEYKQSSPITFANQLQGQLLLVHGTGDDNVHYQGSEALINALVAANKQFTMMSYPNRSHGIYEGAGTTRHLYGLLTRFLNEKLPAGPRGE
ncbi:MAG TPA: S9 family peptidase [Blastocatellia bacterium]|nr:S9 family peptidase [Blastocatellia bacterium]HMX28003.1 S9 family peptidase [Blastocatellia bacterium]HMZ20216.1 S9 family peptidase [Blastocatellia bacterium]HNG32478.1 S9 family peptidase [Blastocatellia bacterium]